jgi:lipid A 4'-phosphatase
MTLYVTSPRRSYMRRQRTQTILVCFLTCSLLFVAFADVDLQISRLFFDDGFYMANQPWTRLLHQSVPWVIAASIGLFLGTLVFNRLFHKSLLGIDGRQVAYLLLVLTMGAGFVVNGVFKDGFGRARPRDVVEFGGTSHFTPAWSVSSVCDRNCSFSSGDSAGAFFTLAIAAAQSRRRLILNAAVGFGVLVSAARIASGAHFLSDTVVSFFVMLIATDAIWYRMFLYEYAGQSLAPVPALLMAAAEKPPLGP